MKRDMTQWVKDMIAADTKKAMPVLSFPAIHKLGITVKELISDSDLQANGMAEVAKATDAAASVSLMDLSLEAEAFGATIQVFEDEVPSVTGALVESDEDAEALQVPEIGAGRTRIYIDAMEKAVKLIEDRPVFAGIIGPFSLAGRLLDVTEAMIYCYEEPDMVHTVLEKATEFLIEYCKAYKAVGANGVVMAEPLAGLLSPALSEEFSAEYVKKIVDAVQDDHFIVVYHNCGDGVLRMTESILSTGCLVYHYGNAIAMEEMMEKMPSDVLVMGNVDPAGVLRNGNPAMIKEETKAIMEKCCKYPNFVISSGCDIPPMTSWENIQAFFEAVEEFYQA